MKRLLFVSFSGSHKTAAGRDPYKGLRALIWASLQVTSENPRRTYANKKAQKLRKKFLGFNAFLWC